MIVDNVQIEIENIHFRIEDKEETLEKEGESLNSFAMGLTLDKLNVNTVDA